MEISSLQTINHQIKLEAMGQVVPAVEIELNSQVSGEIIEISDNFISGRYLQKAEKTLSIDKLDYELAVQIKEAVLKQAEADSIIELGRQKLATSRFTTYNYLCTI